MFRIISNSGNCILGCGLALAVLFPLADANAAYRETVLHSFQGASDGMWPAAGVITDNFGNLYGTTSVGGSGGAGTVFKLAPDGTYSVLHGFTDGADGGYPSARLIMDGAGDLYGTTYDGGAGGMGTIFEVLSDGVETVLHSFCSPPKCTDDNGQPDGDNPIPGLMMDNAGDLFGTTLNGGAGLNGGSAIGTIFELSFDGKETVLYNFCADYPNCSDGAGPYGGVIADNLGNLYGTTYYGGGGGDCSLDGCGTVFELGWGGGEAVLHAFAGGSDGIEPSAGLIMDGAGNLYGTTYGGGDGNQGSGCGIVFKIAPGGVETVLHAVNCGSDGANPDAGLIMDSAGNLYGTTAGGGAHGQGAVIEIAPNGTETVLYSFCSQNNCSDGNEPEADLIMDGAGNLYGTTYAGGANGEGTVFKLIPIRFHLVTHN